MQLLMFIFPPMLINVPAIECSSPVVDPVHPKKGELGVAYGRVCLRKKINWALYMQELYCIT